MKKSELINKLINKKAENDNIIDLSAYEKGLNDIYDYYNKPIKMKKYIVNLGSFRQAIFELDGDNEIIKATLKQGIDEIEASKFAEIFDVDYVLKHGIEQVY